MTDIAQPAPDFTLPSSNGGTVTLSRQRPKTVVLYFYPRDDTPGCTTEALDFTALADAFDSAGAAVFGISRDSLASHGKFAAKHGLGVELLADEDGAVCQAYGVWVEKNMYGGKHMGIERSTFLIGGDGRVAQLWRKVKVKGHADQVLAAVRAL